MLAVYDGHGKQGHSCARFAKKRLPRAVAKHVRKMRVKKYQTQLKKMGTLKGAKTFDPENWPPLEPDEYKEACQVAFVECNQEMHKASKVSRWL